MKPWYAANARTLLETRQRGNAPAGPVVVSLIGGQFFDVADVTLHVHSDMPAERLDWRMLVNLEVWIWADCTVPLDRLLLVVWRIAQSRPRRLVLRFDQPFRFAWNDGKQDIEEAIDTHDVEVGAGQHFRAVEGASEQHDFLWCPLNATGTPVGRQLRDALVRQHGRVAQL